jgi:hypothetical protein
MMSGGANVGCTVGAYVQGICTYTQGGGPFGASHESCSVDNGKPGCPTNGASGVAWDPDDGTIWVADYLGAPQTGGPQYGVTEYFALDNSALGASAQTFNYATQFAPTSPTQEPYAIAVCPKSATGGTTLIVVGFTDDGQGGIRSVQPFTTSGAPVGPPLTGDLGGLSALSCDAVGNVYIADTMGLFRNPVTSSGFTPGQNASLASPGFAGLTPPIYGVFAGPFPPPVADAGTDASGGSDGSVGSDGGGQPDAPVPLCDGGACANGFTAATLIPDDIDGGPLEFCKNIIFTQGTTHAACDNNLPATSTCACLYPSPVGGKGSLCCSSSVGVCNNPGTANDSTWTTCFDFNSNLVADYYQGSWPASTCSLPNTGPGTCVGMSGIPVPYAGDGVCPANQGPVPPSEYGNCTNAPPGYIISMAMPAGGSVMENNGGCSSCAPGLWTP